LENFDKAITEGSEEQSEYAVINLGTGNGVTVKEFLVAFENVVGKQLPVSIQPPRPGDTAGAYANANKAKRLLGWQAEKSIEEGIADALKWGEVRDTIIHY
jgi:UDP-glucose 4-epimerase